MIISLTLTNFRNHKSVRIDMDSAQNVILVGGNGTGKTAVAEALSMLSGERGMRGAPSNEIAHFGTNNYAIFARMNTGMDVSLSWDGTTRRAQINGERTPLYKLSEMFKIVWLTPREDRIFLEPVSERRAFFDRLVNNIYPKHNGHVARLSKLLSERAFALKNRADDAWISGIETQIAHYANDVSQTRNNYICDLSPYFKLGLNQNMPGNYAEYLKNNRELIGDKQNIDGPHKSDFFVFSEKFNMNAHMLSTGQQKSVLYDLIMAHSGLTYAKTGLNPMIILDEVVAHLDENAKNMLFKRLSNLNTFVVATGINSELFAGIPNTKLISLPL